MVEGVPRGGKVWRGMKRAGLRVEKGILVCEMCVSFVSKAVCDVWISGP